MPRFHEIMREQTAISANDGRDWRMFILKAYGTEFPHNMAVCPNLAAAVAASPEVLSASLSFLAPRKHIPVHRGHFAVCCGSTSCCRCRLRLTVGLRRC